MLRTLTLFILFFLVFLINVSTGQTATDGFELGSDYPTCGDCWCAPDNNGTAPCPGNSPPTNFSQSVIDLFKDKVPLAIYSLQCNPYTNDSCVTTPAQDSFANETEAVCGFLYSGSCPNTTYNMVSYESRSAANKAGAFVTHAGVCGLCSTAEDLAIYLSEDFTAAGKKCATEGLLNEDAGLKCYMKLGLTEECARIWNYDGIYDGQACLTSCVSELKAPNNGPPPACALNKCLQCDEDKAGPNFAQFAARTRRRSGLLSEIIRPCSTIAQDIVHDPQC